MAVADSSWLYQGHPARAGSRREGEQADGPGRFWTGAPGCQAVPTCRAHTATVSAAEHRATSTSAGYGRSAITSKPVTWSARGRTAESHRWRAIQYDHDATSALGPEPRVCGPRKDVHQPVGDAGARPAGRSAKGALPRRRKGPFTFTSGQSSWALSTPLPAWGSGDPHGLGKQERAQAYTLPSREHPPRARGAPTTGTGRHAPGTIPAGAGSRRPA